MIIISSQFPRGADFWAGYAVAVTNASENRLFFGIINVPTIPGKKIVHPAIGGNRYMQCVLNGCFGQRALMQQMFCQLRGSA
jgi:hypothetical protein